MSNIEFLDHQEAEKFNKQKREQFWWTPCMFAFVQLTQLLHKFCACLCKLIFLICKHYSQFNFIQRIVDLLFFKIVDFCIFLLTQILIQIRLQIVVQRRKPTSPTFCSNTNANPLPFNNSPCPLLRIVNLSIHHSQFCVFS